MPPPHLGEGGAGALPAQGIGDGLDHLVVGPVGHHHAGEEVLGRHAPDFSAAAQVNLALQRHEAEGDFRARVGMGDGAAQRPTRPGLDVPDPRQGGGQQRQIPRETRPVEEDGLPHARRDDESPLVETGLFEGGDAHHVDEDGGLCQPHVEHRHQGLAARDDPRLGAVLAQGFEGVVQGCGAEVVEGSGLHAGTPRRASRRRRKAGSREDGPAEPPARRARAVKNPPMITRAAPSRRRPPTAATLPPTAAS